MNGLSRLRSGRQAHRAPVPRGRLRWKAVATACILASAATALTACSSGGSGSSAGGHITLTELDDYPAGLPQSDAFNQRWQERMAGLLETVHDYSEDGAEAVLPVVWQLCQDDRRASPCLGPGRPRPGLDRRAGDGGDPAQLRRRRPAAGRAGGRGDRDRRGADRHRGRRDARDAGPGRPRPAGRGRGRLDRPDQPGGVRRTGPAQVRARRLVPGRGPAPGAVRARPGLAAPARGPAGPAGGRRGRALLQPGRAPAPAAGGQLCRGRRAGPGVRARSRRQARHRRRRARAVGPAIRDLAARPNTVCKLSGLVTEAPPGAAAQRSRRSPMSS